MGKRGERHVPTDLLRGKVSAYVSTGMKQDLIAQILKISKQTLAKHYKQELETAEAKLTHNVTMKFIELIMSDGNPAAREKAMEFYLSRRGGWIETQRVEHGGRDGSDMPSTPGVVVINNNGQPEPHIALPPNYRDRPEPLTLPAPIEGTFEEVR